LQSSSPNNHQCKSENPACSHKTRRPAAKEYAFHQVYVYKYLSFLRLLQHAARSTITAHGSDNNLKVLSGAAAFTTTCVRATHHLAIFCHLPPFDKKHVGGATSTCVSVFTFVREEWSVPLITYLLFTKDYAEIVRVRDEIDVENCQDDELRTLREHQAPGEQHNSDKGI
jgi:hypothetical protein